jgi:peptide chain release factor 1
MAPLPHGASHAALRARRAAAGDRHACGHVALPSAAHTQVRGAPMTDLTSDPMKQRLDAAERRYRELEDELGRPECLASPPRLREVSQELAGLRETVLAYQDFRSLLARLATGRELCADPDPEIRELAREEIAALESQREEAEARLRQLLIPPDPNDGKNIVLEIRAGTGGEEAALFASDLLRMYTRYAESKGWTIELLSVSQTDGGGFREVIASISGQKVYRHLKHESGVHRVQRVPVTESQGRIHTSTVTVAVLPEAAPVDVALDEQKDLRIDVYRSSGPGGQSVNTTDSAVRITHLPTGLIVTCQDEKSQHKNRAKALKILRSRLYDMELARQAAERADERRGQIGMADRSERIRTYNFAQSRVTDHRIGLTLHKLDRMLEGDIDEMIEALTVELQARALAEDA